MLRKVLHRMLCSQNNQEAHDHFCPCTLSFSPCNILLALSLTPRQNIGQVNFPARTLIDPASNIWSLKYQLQHMLSSETLTWWKALTSNRSRRELMFYIKAVTDYQDSYCRLQLCRHQLRFFFCAVFHNSLFAEYLQATNSNQVTKWVMWFLLVMDVWT